jgi:hypothetical protein
MMATPSPFNPSDAEQAADRILVTAARMADVGLLRARRRAIGIAGFGSADPAMAGAS